MLPLFVNVPFTVMVPAPSITSDAPADTVMSSTVTPVAISGLFYVTPITISSHAEGTESGFQFCALFQSLLTVPVH